MIGPESMGISIQKLRRNLRRGPRKGHRGADRLASAAAIATAVAGLCALLFFSTTPQASPFLSAQGILPPGAQQPVTSIASFEGREFVDAFNAASDRTRLVLVFSPT